MSEGDFRQRTPPKSTWISEHEESRPIIATMCAKGLVPVHRITRPDAVNTLIPDIMEISGIDYLRENKHYYEAIMKANTHSEFQGKRILILKYIDEQFTREELLKISKIRRKCHSKDKRLGRWTTQCVNNILYQLDIIAKDEFEALEKLREISNELTSDRRNLYIKCKCHKPSP